MNVTARSEWAKPGVPPGHWKAFVVLMFLSLASCATAAQKDDARKAWEECILNAIAKLDDGKTDPVSLAYGISPQCASQYQRLTELMVQGYITDAGQANMRENMRDAEIKLITSAVLTYRASGKR